MVPPPSAEHTLISPPCALTIARAMKSPRPMLCVASSEAPRASDSKIIPCVASGIGLPIVHAERNALVRAMSLEGDRASTPMLDRVPHQVRYDLRKSIGVPFTADAPAYAETHDRLRLCGLHLQKDLVTQLL